MRLRLVYVPLSKARLKFMPSTSLPRPEPDRSSGLQRGGVAALATWGATQEIEVYQRLTPKKGMAPPPRTCHSYRTFARCGSGSPGLTQPLIFLDLARFPWRADRDSTAPAVGARTGPLPKA